MKHAWLNEQRRCRQADSIRLPVGHTRHTMRATRHLKDQAKHEWAGSRVMLIPNFTSFISFFRGRNGSLLLLQGVMKHAWLKEKHKCRAGRPIESACRWVNSHTPDGKASQLHKASRSFCDMHGKLHAHSAGAFAMYECPNFCAT